MRTSEEKARYDQDYIRRNCVRMSVLLNKVHDADIIEFLRGSGESFNARVKRLIREEIDGVRGRAEYEEHVRKVREELGPIEIPAGEYRDDEACKIAIEKEHRIYVEWRGEYEVRIDVDARKVLTVRNLWNMKFDSPKPEP